MKKIIYILIFSLVSGVVFYVYYVCGGKVTL